MTSNHQEGTTRHMLNDAYEYGLEAQGVFNPDLANAALGEIDRRLQKHISHRVNEEVEAVLEAVQGMLQKPSNYDNLTTVEQVNWVIMDRGY